MIAKDTGTAITGAQRADVFFGTISKAGIAAGLTIDPGRIVVFISIQGARAKVLGQ
jgi:membrane-bound lytic murein transglycosylase A